VACSRWSAATCAEDEMSSITISGVRGYRRLTLVNTFTKAVADRMLLVLLAGIGVALMNVAMGPMYASLEDTIAEVMGSMPDVFRAIAGVADETTAAGFYTAEVYSMVAPFVVIYVALASATKAFGGEVEDRTMGLLMANPVPRTRLAIDKLAAMVVHVVLVSVLIGLGTWVGVVIGGLDVSSGNVVAITVHMALLAVVFGTLGMIVSIATARRIMALLAVMLVALVAYLWSGFVPLVDSIAGLASLSPWYHYIGSGPLLNGMDWASAALLVIMASLLAVIAIALFKRRDISG